MLVDRALVAPNVSPVALIVSPDAPSVRFNVSRKWALFAIPPADVREPLQLGGTTGLAGRSPLGVAHADAAADGSCRDALDRVAPTLGSQGPATPGSARGRARPAYSRPHLTS